MPDVNINRLSLHLSGLSEHEGRRLAQLIADGLGAATLDGASCERESMESTATARPGANLQALSDHVVADLVRQLERSF